MDRFRGLHRRLLLLCHVRRLAVGFTLTAHLEALGAPPCQDFHVVGAQDRCWTADRLARHGLPPANRCLLCDQEPESMHHLLIGCSFSRQLWHEVLAWCRSTANPPHPTDHFLNWWLLTLVTSPSSCRKGLSSLFLPTTWHLWKHWNGCVFDASATLPEPSPSAHQG